jgi:hypothetical protein
MQVMRYIALRSSSPPRFPAFSAVCFPAFPCFSLRFPAFPCGSLLFPAVPCFSLRFPAFPCVGCDQTAPRPVDPDPKRSQKNAKCWRRGPFKLLAEKPVGYCASAAGSAAGSAAASVAFSRLTKRARSRLPCSCGSSLVFNNAVASSLRLNCS